jgi:glycine/sarcosine N-methyltransferase
MFKLRDLMQSKLATSDMAAINDANETNSFYDAIADHYHLFFRDWQAVMQREGSALRRVFRAANAGEIGKVLDASCGTGTQAISLAALGYEVTAADASQAMLQKAQANAKAQNVADDMTFINVDFLGLRKALTGHYDAVVSKGNALPHLLTDDELRAALQNFYDLLRAGGLVAIGIQDFDLMLEDRPRFVPRQVHLDDPERDVILFDIYEWEDTEPVRVKLNTFIVSGKEDAYTANRFGVTYRALRRAELEAMLAAVGFTQIKVESQTWELLFTAQKPA